MKPLHKKGQEQVSDWAITIILILISFFCSLFVLGVSKESTQIAYKTSLAEIHDEQALNHYLKYPVDNTELISIAASPEGKESLITTITKNYFTDYYGDKQWWVISTSYPENKELKTTSSAAKSGQKVAAQAYIPTEKGIAQITLFRDKQNDLLVLANINNPGLAIYYALFG
jgi:hypothetical protein